MTSPVTDHVIDFSTLPDLSGRSIDTEHLTLPMLATAIKAVNASTKTKLPLLKLAVFGTKATPKGSLRHNANVQYITGVEADYDAGKIKFTQAVNVIHKAGLRAIVYTSPSFKPGANERWRVLAPTSEQLPPERRETLVARLNGLFKGALGDESFTLSQSFYFGRVDGNPHHQVQWLDGDFIDRREDLDQGAIGRRPPQPASAAEHGDAHGRSDAELALLLDQSRDKGHWHLNLLRVTASLAARGCDEAEIRTQVSPYCDGGAEDPDLDPLIEGAIAKFGLNPKVTIGLKALLEPIAAEAAKAGSCFSDNRCREKDNRCHEKTGVLITGPEAPPRPVEAASFRDKVNWLLATHAFCQNSDRVVELHEPSGACELTRPAFGYGYLAWHEINEKKLVPATKIWALSPTRLNVAGVRMSPDRPFPTYRELGKIFKNTYRRPMYAAGGELAPFLAFLDRFIPDGREREWLLDWMAHKQAKPEIPGTCVVFVADQEDATRGGRFGTGRGLMFRIVHKLYGEQYARAEQFSILDGSSGQAVYTDWMAGSVLVTVDESRASPTAYRRGERNAAYEVLKDIVDPAPKRRSFKVKYGAAFDGVSYCSLWVATNHADALAIPAADRRFTVLRNGREITPAEAREIVAWLERPANIGALSRYLAERVLVDFDMFQPLETVGKAAMAELARSSVEEILDDLIEDDSRGLVFTKQNLEDEVSRHFSVHAGPWRGEFNAAWLMYCAGLTGLNIRPFRVRSGGTQRKLFCFRKNAPRVRKMPEAAVRRHAAKWGHLDTIETQLVGLTGPTGLGQKDPEPE